MTLVIVDRYTKKLLSGRRRALGGMIKYPLRQWLVSTATNQLGLHIASREELLNHREYQVFPFGSPEVIAISPPRTSQSELPHSLTSRTGSFTLKKPFVCEVANANLIGPRAVGFNQQGHLISETVGPLKKTVQQCLPMRTLLLKSLPSLGTTQLESACSLVTCLARRNYWHWMADCLTQFEGLEYYQQQTGVTPTLIVDDYFPKWKRESLMLLGYDPDQCLRWDRSRLKVKRLVVPSFRRQLRYVSPTACRWLRQRILSNLPQESQSFSPRVYISRPQSAGRHVLNEAEVLQALAPWGFKAYTLEKMSFADQVRLFSQAEMVVAPHGAGLANIIFAENLSVIELYGSLIAPVYLVLANALGFDYGCLTSGQSESEQHSEKYSGIRVNIPNLRDLVAEML